VADIACAPACGVRFRSCLHQQYLVPPPLERSGALQSAPEKMAPENCPPSLERSESTPEEGHISESTLECSGEQLFSLERSGEICFLWSALERSSFLQSTLERSRETLFCSGVLESTPETGTNKKKISRIARNSPIYILYSYFSYLATILQVPDRLNTSNKLRVRVHK
jgi:hypothetical protein